MITLRRFIHSRRCQGLELGLQLQSQPKAPEGEDDEWRRQQVQQPGVQVELQDDAKCQGHAQNRVAAGPGILHTVFVILVQTSLGGGGGDGLCRCCLP